MKQKEINNLKNGDIIINKRGKEITITNVKRWFGKVEYIQYNFSLTKCHYIKKNTLGYYTLKAKQHQLRV